MPVTDTNDPNEILKNPYYKVLSRLREDSNKLQALAEVDRNVLRGLVDPAKRPATERDERSQQALRCFEVIAKNAAEARHALDQIPKVG